MNYPEITTGLSARYWWAHSDGSYYATDREMDERARRFIAQQHKGKVVPFRSQSVQFRIADS